MQAIVLTELGGLDGIRAGEVATPVAAPGEVLIRVGTVAVNRQDLNLIFGRFSVPGFELPHELGLDPAGVVAGLGEGVHDLALDDRVVAKPPIACTGCPACMAGEDDACERIRSVGIHRPGGMAEYVSVPRRNVFAIPPDVSMATATAFSHSFPVALTLLRKIGLTAADDLLVSGASGAVGSAVVQLARNLGATVIGAVSRAAGRDWLQALPRAIAPDAVIDLAATPAFAADVRAQVPAGISAYVETASDPAVWSEALKSLGRGARVAVVGAHAGPRVEIDNNWLFRQRVSIIGCSGSSVSAYAESLALLGRGGIEPHIDSVVPMSEAASAYGRLRSRDNQGKIVLRVADDIE
jgi:acryloyl-coenzyme A reductase